jgi:hypothetical protein
MKRLELNFKHGESLSNLPKAALILMFLFALDLSFVSNADAQRNGGGHYRSGLSRGYVRPVGMGHSALTHGRNLSRDFHMGRGIRIHRGLSYRYYPFIPQWGDYYWGIPPYEFRFIYDGLNFYYGDGIYYRYHDDRYEVVPAPEGYQTKVIPKDSFRFTLDGIEYYYFNGSYYIPKDNRYEVVRPPVGAVVNSIPQEYDKMEIDGQTYFILHGVQYKAIVKNDQVWYQVVKN